MTNIILQVLARQFGVITRSQALKEISEARLRLLLASEWRILLPGVYLAGRGKPTIRQWVQAGLLYAGETAMIADASALTAYGIRYLPEDPTLRLLIDASVTRANRDGVVSRRTHRLPTPRQVNGFPVCPPERALAEFAAQNGVRRDAIAVMADAVQRKIADLGELAAEVPHLTGRGAACGRDSIGAVLEGIRSAPEADFADIYRSINDMPPVLFNPLLRLPGGQIVSPDALVVDAGFVHETNSREHHEGEDLFVDMQSRHDLMTTPGLALLHNAPTQLREERGRIRAQVESICRQRAGHGLPPGVELLRTSIWPYAQ